MDADATALGDVTDNRIAWQDGELLIDLQVMAPVQNSGNAAQKIYILFTSYC